MTIDVIRLAKEAGIEPKPMILDGVEYEYKHVEFNDNIGGDEFGCIERFAALVATALQEEANRKANAGWALMCKKMVEAEREECAKVCDELAEINRRASTDSMWQQGECAAAIRARKP